jgi:hypothetical protein
MGEGCLVDAHHFILFVWLQLKAPFGGSATVVFVVKTESARILNGIKKGSASISMCTLYFHLHGLIKVWKEYLTTLFSMLPECGNSVADRLFDSTTTCNDGVDADSGAVFLEDQPSPLVDSEEIPTNYSPPVYVLEEKVVLQKDVMEKRLLRVVVFRRVRRDARATLEQRVRFPGTLAASACAIARRLMGVVGPSSTITATLDPWYTVRAEQKLLDASRWIVDSCMARICGLRARNCQVSGLQDEAALKRDAQLTSDGSILLERPRTLQRDPDILEIEAIPDFGNDEVVPVVTLVLL